MSMTLFRPRARRLLLLGEDLPPLILGPGCAMDPGDPSAPRVPRKGGPVALMVDGSALRVEREAVPWLRPWDRGRLVRGHLEATFPGADLVAGRMRPRSADRGDDGGSGEGEADGAALLMAGLSDGGGILATVEAWRSALADRGIAAHGPYCPALAAPGLAQWLMARRDPGPHPATPWTVVVVQGRGGTRLVVARDGLPQLARLAPPGLDGPALADELRGTLAYSRRRGFRPDQSCSVVLLGDGLLDRERARADLEPLTAGGEVLIPDGQALDRLLAPPATGIAPDALLAWAALSDPLTLSMPLGSPGGARTGGMTASSLGRVAPWAAGALALGGLALGLVETRALEVMEARRAGLETELDEARAVLELDRAALERLPAPPEALRAHGARQGPGGLDPRRDLEWIAANLGQTVSVERIDLVTTPLGIRWILTLASPEGSEAARAALSEAFPGYKVTLTGGDGPDAATRAPGTAAGKAVLLLDPEGSP